MTRLIASQWNGRGFWESGGEPLVVTAYAVRRSYLNGSAAGFAALDVDDVHDYEERQPDWRGNWTAPMFDTPEAALDYREGSQ